jgi:hypothetical protein
MRSLSIPAVLLSLAVSQSAYSQYGFEDFLKAVESGQQNNLKLNSARLAQLPEGPEELPAPKPSALDAGVPSLENAPSRLGEKSVESSSDVPSRSNAPKPLPPVAPTPVPEPSPMQSTSVEETSAPPMEHEESLIAHDHGSLISSDAYASSGSDCGCGAHARTSFGTCSSCDAGSCGVRTCNVLSHYPVNLPPPSTLRGYFNASPCVANVWDGYACDAAKECNRTQHRIQFGQAPPHSACTDRTRCD